MIVVRHAHLAGRAVHIGRPTVGRSAVRVDVSYPSVEGEAMASAVTTNSVFKRAVPARDKAETTTSIARSIAEAEVAAREAKTARLRQLRLAKEAADQEARAGEVAAKRAKAKGKKAR
jgi:hypothetical protein